MLFAQITTPPPVPAAPPVAEVRGTDDGRTAPTDARTTRENDARPGQRRDANDTRTTRDSAYDERATEEAPPPRFGVAYDPAFQASPSVRAAARLAEEEGTTFRPGGVDYGADVALIEGYNDNVVQSQDVIPGPVTRHPSPFTGVDLGLTLRAWTSPFDPHEFRVDLRGQHYTPLEKYDQPDDGAVVFSYNGQVTLGKRDVLVNRLHSTVATLNSSRLSDGPLFLVEPAALQRTFTMTMARSQLMHEIAPRWRYQHAVDFSFGTTLYDPTLYDVGGETVQHRGVDFLQPGTDGTIFYDVTESDVASLRARYELNYNNFLVDFTRVPPAVTGGSTATTHIGELTAGLTHAFTDSLRMLTSVGAAVATAPPLDPDTRPVMSPVANAQLLYTRQYWTFDVNAGYSYGSASPRLGFGPSATASTQLQGYPWPHTDGLRHLALLLAATANRSAFRTTGDESRISFVVASAEGRYAVNNWLGVLFGYNYRYVVFEGAEQLPKLYRHVVFIGLSGYWNTDRSLPLITTFSAPTSSG